MPKRWILKLLVDKQSVWRTIEDYVDDYDVIVYNSRTYKDTCQHIIYP